MKPASSLTQPSILVVEDNQDLNVAICDILESYGYQTFSAGDGFAALEEFGAAESRMSFSAIS